MIRQIVGNKHRSQLHVDGASMEALVGWGALEGMASITPYRSMESKLSVPLGLDLMNVGEQDANMRAS